MPCADEWSCLCALTLPEQHTAEGTRYTIRLWRPELLTGVIELNERMTVLKADPVAGAWGLA